MVECVYIDPLAPVDYDRYDIDPSTIKSKKFFDKKAGKESFYTTGTLLYRDPRDNLFKPPFFLVEGDSYGLQKGNGNKEQPKDGAAPAIPGMIPLGQPFPPMANLPGQQQPGAPAAGAEGGDKDKWQIAIQLSEKPAERDWTPKEKGVIDFIDTLIRKILCFVLCKRIEIVNKVCPNVVIAAREQFQERHQVPNGQAPSPEQMAYFQEVLKDKIYGKISRKVYRKKLEQKKEGSAFNPLDASGQYDDTKFPTLYAGVPSFVDKATKVEKFTKTVFLQYLPDVSEEDWPKLSQAEAVAKGAQHVQVGVRFDDVYFGASIASQPKAAEVAFMRATQGGGMHKGRMIKAPEGVPRNTRLITRTNLGSDGGAPVASAEAGGIEPVNPLNSGVLREFNPGLISSVPGIGSGVPQQFQGGTQVQQFQMPQQQAPGGYVPQVASGYGAPIPQFQMPQQPIPQANPGAPAPYPSGGYQQSGIPQ